MHLVFYAQIVHAERERALKEAIRIRRLLEAQDEAVAAHPPRIQRADTGRSWIPRVRPTGG